jgi:CRISPR-associated protein Cst2
MTFYNIVFITKVNVASLNGSEGTGGNITPIKKVSDNQGNEYAYISGQAQRRYLKETLRQLGHRITAVNEKGEPDFQELNGEIISESKIKNKKLMYSEFCDMDLFGYMFPKGGRRWSPVKVAPMISLQPYKGEYDYLTRKQKTGDEERSGNIVQVEIDTLNYMRGNIIVDVDKIGYEINEYTYEQTKMLDDSQINNRINALIDAIKYYNGGAKQARHLEELSPKFVIAVKQKTGNPFMLNSIKTDRNDRLIIEPLIEALKENTEIIDKAHIGISTSAFENNENICKSFAEVGYKVLTVYKALDNLKRG